MAAITAIGFEFSEDARRILSILDALHLIEFDRPKKGLELYERASEALYGRGVRCNEIALEDILKTAGLKIVEIER